ncbi:MAG: PAS domain S-box protein [Anaerolineales bacterium]|nr:PAS domain S-box protein [Anaerolineales bacterium]
MNRKKWFLITLLLTVFISLKADYILAQENTGPSDPLILSDEQGTYQLGLHLEILEDPDGQLTIADVVTSEWASQFVPSEETTPNLGTVKTAVWVRFHVKNESVETNQWLLELALPLTDDVTIYVPAPDSTTFETRQSGSLHPFATRDIPDHNIVFKLPLATGETQTIYVRLENKLPISIPLTIWSPADFSTHSHRDQLVVAMFLGMFLIMIGYHIFLTVSLRELMSFYLALGMVGFSIFLVTWAGYAGQYLWPNTPALYRLVLPLSMILTVGSSLQFAISILEIKDRIPKLLKAHYFLLAALGLLAILSFLIPFSLLFGALMVLSLLSILFLFVVGISARSQGIVQSRYYLLAWVPIMLLFTWDLLSLLNVVPQIELDNYQNGATAWLLLMWSLALADRINRLKINLETVNLNLRGREQDLLHSLEVVQSTNEALRLSEERFSKVFRASPDSIVISSQVDGRYIDVNDNFLKSTGYNHSEIIGYTSIEKNIWANLADRDRFIQIFQDQGSVRDLEAEYRAKSGETGIVLMSAEAIEIEGEPCLVTISRDITERKQMEDALRQHKEQLERKVAARTAELSEANNQLQQEIAERSQVEKQIQRQNIFLNNVIESLSNPFYVINVQDYTIELANTAARALGISSMATCYALTHHRSTPCDGLDHPCPLAVVKKNKTSTVVEHIHYNKEGRPIFVEVHGYPIFDSAGNVVQMIEYSIDITERKHAEDNLRKLSSAVEQSGSGIVITNLANKIEFVNPAFATITGYTAAEVMGKDPDFLQSGKTSRLVYQEMWAAIRQGKVWQGEMLNKKKNGDLYWQFMTVSPIKNQDGDTTHYLAVQEDISELKHIEEELRTARDNAQAANQAKSTFLANMSHELRTPLAAIIGYSEMLQEQVADSLNGKIITRLQSIHTAAHHLLGIINDILNIARIETNKVELNWETFAVQTLVDNVLETARPTISRNNNRLHVECPPNLGVMIADSAKVRQILLNLLSNAGKFTTNGDISLRIFRDVMNGNQEDTEQVVFQVTDTGIGMTSEQLTKVFQPFVQVDNSATRQYGGTGLGLAINQHFCNMMGGEISVESEVGHGSTFTIRLPTQGNRNESFDKNFIS